ncbi:hypothetical protein [Planktothrix mougeotii]|uniref:DUF1145 domain-containing protein n=1 Tax=Planktothrix mougeotii LEGE 06226 TaxID=1828728 RepID=A0ABR9UFU4_9CYAN|nr:hypothetical protein [Planktothrix mougeotii]MBE9145337.1 hypothetical protein [Planktothrix mougeotii LEGE 06226]
MPIFRFIKLISTLLITSALGLEVWNLITGFIETVSLNWLNWIVIIERLAITIHGAEALIVSYYARSKNKHPLQYGIYTFFVGTVGLLELFTDKTDQINWKPLIK